MGADRERSQRRGAAPRAASPSQSLGFGSAGKASGGAYLAYIQGLGGVLDAITVAGDALLIGRTSDGGAVSLTLMSGDMREKQWAHSQEELQAAIDWLRNHYMPVRPVPPSSTGG